MTDLQSRKRGEYRLGPLLVQCESLVAVGETRGAQARCVWRRASGLVGDAVDLQAAEPPLLVGLDQRIGPVRGVRPSHRLAAVGVDARSQQAATPARALDHAPAPAG